MIPEARPSIIEILNTGVAAITDAIVKIYDESGALVEVIDLSASPIPARGSFHLITDSVLGLGKLGSATIESSSDALAAVVMQYKRDSNLGIEYMYGIAATASTTDEKKGSYNTNIEQVSNFMLLNTSNQQQSYTFLLRDLNGNNIGDEISYTLAAHAHLRVNLNEFVAINTYGAVMLLGGSSGNAWVLRERGVDYIIETPLR